MIYYATARLLIRQINYNGKLKCFKNMIHVRLQKNTSFLLKWILKKYSTYRHFNQIWSKIKSSMTVAKNRYFELFPSFASFGFSTSLCLSEKSVIIFSICLKRVNFISFFQIIYDIDVKLFYNTTFNILTVYCHFITFKNSSITVAIYERIFDKSTTCMI